MKREVMTAMIENSVLYKAAEPNKTNNPYRLYSTAHRDYFSTLYYFRPHSYWC